MGFQGTITRKLIVYFTRTRTLLVNFAFDFSKVARCKLVFAKLQSYRSEAKRSVLSYAVMFRLIFVRRVRANRTFSLDRYFAIDRLFIGNGKDFS